MTASDRSSWKPLTRKMEEAISEYDLWSSRRSAELDEKNKVSSTLYHYTDGRGLAGIIENEELWLTSHAHLNDPGEIAFGMSVAIELLNEIGKNSDPRINIFCKMVIDLFSKENLDSAFGFYIASLSKDGDELGQWRGYGDNGKGYSIGLAPHLFHPTADIKTDPSENFVVLPVVYGKEAGREMHLPAITKALEIVGSIVGHEAETMRDAAFGMPFFDRLSMSLISSELILNSLLIKHDAYINEKEVRLVLVGEHKNLLRVVSRRTRGSEIVPYIKSKFPLRKEESIVEVVVGPSASGAAEDGVNNLMGGSAKRRIRRSSIPYRSS